ncbi:hypothetical protein KJ855_04680 [Patescibacteria group bacterium]|nr:hypothetical protein [Patescibacteria group bacterium]
MNIECMKVRDKCEIEIMGDERLGGLEDGVGRGRDGRLVIGKLMNLRELGGWLPQMGIEYDGVLLDQIDGIKNIDEPPVMDDRLQSQNMAGAKKLVMLSQGLKAPKNCPSNNWIRHFLLGYNISTLSFEYYKGNKEADVSIQKRAGDLVDVVQKYKKRGYLVGGYGSSIGGTALCLAASRLWEEYKIRMDVLVNRTIIPLMDRALVNELNNKIKGNSIDINFIKNNIDLVCDWLGRDNIGVSAKELRELCNGEYNVDKYIENVKCPLLNVQGSEDKKADMGSVREIMSRNRVVNKDSLFIEIAGADHGCRNNDDYYKMQLYLLLVYIKGKMSQKFVSF